MTDGNYKYESTSYAKTVNVPAGAIIITPETSGSAYLIRSGRVRVLNQGKELGERGPRQFIGLMSALSDTSPFLTVTALENCSLVEVPRDYLRKLVEQSDSIIQTGISEFSRYARSQEPSAGLIVPEAAANRIFLASDFRAAVESYNAIRFHYQPVVALKSGKITGFEALMRWTTQDGSHIPPGRFIPTIEETPLIHDTSYFALHEACNAVARIKAATGQAYNISVNFSTSDFLDPNFAQNVASIVKECGYRTDKFYIEITEGTLASAEQTKQTLEECHKMKIRCALDDFGTGFSSIQYLRDFPIDILKIDKSFVSDITTNERSKKAVRFIIALAKAVDAHTIAEGVETKEQAKVLKNLGANMAQGYYFSRPIPEEELIANLRSYDTLPPPAVAGP